MALDGYASHLRERVGVDVFVWALIAGWVDEEDYAIGGECDERVLDRVREITVGCVAARGDVLVVEAGDGRGLHVVCSVDCVISIG